MRRASLALAMLCLIPSLSYAQTVTPDPVPQSAPKWAVILATAGPIADGLTTYHALQVPGIIEGNDFYRQLLGSNVKPGEILAFKVGQAALTGAIIHAGGKHNRKAAIGVAIATAVINFGASYWNVKQANHARQLNRGQR